MNSHLHRLDCVPRLLAVLQIIVGIACARRHFALHSDVAQVLFVLGQQLCFLSMLVGES